VAEELRFEQGFRQGRATDLDERPVPPRAEAVDFLGQQTFTGPALAGDQDGGIGVLDPLDQRHDLGHARVERHQAGFRVLAGRLRQQLAQHPQIADALHAAGHGLAGLDEDRRRKQQPDGLAVPIGHGALDVVQRHAALQSPLQGACLLTEGAVQDLVAILPHRLRCRKSRDSLGFAVEAGDAPVGVDGVDAVGNGVQNGLKPVALVAGAAAQFLLVAEQLIEMPHVADILHQAGHGAARVHDGVGGEADAPAGVAPRAVQPNVELALGRPPVQDSLERAVVAARLAIHHLGAGAAQQLLGPQPQHGQSRGIGSHHAQLPVHHDDGFLDGVDDGVGADGGRHGCPSVTAWALRPAMPCPGPGGSCCR